MDRARGFVVGTVSVQGPRPVPSGAASSAGTRGFTLIELLVTLAVAMILMAGLYQFFIARQRTTVAQDEVLQLQQEARIAQEMIGRAVQQTGAYIPSVGMTVSLRGQNILAASDHYLTIQYDNPFRSADRGVITADEVVTFAVSKPSGTITEKVGDDPTVTKTNRTVTVYFDQDLDGQVEASEKFALDIPLVLTGPPYLLYRITPDPANPTAKPEFEVVAARVDNLVFRYYDADGNPIPRDPSTGAAVDPPYVLTAAERARIRSVEVELVLRTRSEDPKFTGSFSLPDNTVGTYDANGNPRTGVTLSDGYRRRVFRTRITPRNLSANVCGRVELRADPAEPACPASSTVTAVVLDRFGDPLSGVDVTFSVDSGSGATLSATTVTTDANGEASTTVNYAGTARAVAVSAMAVVDCSPTGSKATTLTNAIPIRFMPGDPVEVRVGEPSTDTIFTCMDPDAFTFEAHAYDACGNEVDPDPGVSFRAVDSSGATFGSVSITGSVSGTAEFQKTGETFTVKFQGGAVSAPRSGGGFPMNVALTTPLPGWLTTYSGLPFTTPVTLVPWPPASLANWTTDIATASHTDCPSGAVSSTFQVLDCGGNWIDDLTREAGYSVGASIDPDPTGPTDPGTQGTLYSNPDVPDTAAAPSITIQHGSSGTFHLAYKPPSCSLGPPSSQSIQPEVDLALNTPSGPADTASQSLTLGACMDCEITASPTSLDSGTCSTNTQSTTISVGSCTVPDGTSAELEVVSTGGNATWDLSGSIVTTTTGTFSGGVLTKTLYKGNAHTGDKLTIRVYVPDKATYLAASRPTGSVFMCEAPDLITVDSKCDSIHVSNRSFTELGISPNDTLTQNYPDPPQFRSGDKIYIEVYDCDENVNSTVKDTIEVTVTSPQGYSPPAPDVETVVLTETGPDTGIFRNDTNPLPVIYCGFPGVGDTSNNGYLFVREGYPITIQYVDDDDATDNACTLTADIAGFACSAFNYSYFAQNYIHLDRHGIAANLSIGGSVWTNGEFELSSDMTVDARGPDGVYGTGDDYTVVSLGHMSIAGTVIGDVYAPSVDVYGPDGNGQNTQVFGTHSGTIQGNVYLRDGFRYDSSTGTYSIEVIGDDPWEKAPSYGTYESLAAPDVGQPPPGSSVITYSVPAGAITGSVVSNYNTSSPGTPLYDPNSDPTYAQDPPYGEVLVAKDLPTFDFDLAKSQAMDMTTDYHQWAQLNGVTDGVDSDTYFNNVGAFETFIKNTAGKTFTGSCGDTYTSTTSVYIIGDPCEGTVFYVEGGIDFSSMDLGGAQLIVHGSIVAGQPSAGGGGDIKINDGKTTGAITQVAIFGCGQRPKNWASGLPTGVYTDPDSWAAAGGGWEDIPYSLPALVGKNKVEVKNRTFHTATFGIVYSESEIHYHNKVPEGRAFLVGAEIGNVIHNCLYMDFVYNECVKTSSQDWFGCYCDTGGTPVSCTISVSPAAATVTQGGTTVNLTASASGGTVTSYQWSVSGSSGGSVSPSTGSSVTYSSGSSVGTDTVTVTDSGGACAPATATITVIGSCSVTVTPETFTVPVTQSVSLSASSAGGGPFTWSIVQNQSGGALSATTGDSVLYTAGSAGGIDIIRVEDAAGCTAAEAVLTVDPCYVQVSAEEYDGASCTGVSTSTVAQNGTVCLTAVGGSGDLHWFTSDPDGRFSFDGGTTWEAGTETSMTSSYTTSGDTILYRAGSTLGTYTVTAQDPESCQGNQILSTCGMTFDSHAATIYETETLDVSVSNATSTPVTFGASSGSITSTGSTSATFTPAGTGSVTITGQDAVGCTASTVVTVLGCPTLSVDHDPADSPLVVGSTYTLTASGGTADYSWSLSSGSASIAKTSSTTASLVPEAEGTVSVDVTDARGCTGTASYTAVCPSITITHSPSDDPLVMGDTYTLTATGGTGPYTWTLVAGSGTLGSTGSSVSFTPDADGDVEIRVTDAYGCTGTFTALVGCPAPTVAITEPADGSSWGTNTSNGASLTWRAVPDDNDGSADPLDNIDRLEFVIRDPSGTVVHTQTEYQNWYCGFGGNGPCNTEDVSTWVNGTYTLEVTAYTEASHPCGATSVSDSIQITIDNLCSASISPNPLVLWEDGPNGTVTASGTTGSLTWSSSDEDVAEISSTSTTSAEIRPEGEGTAEITVTDASGCSATVDVIVKKLPFEVGRITGLTDAWKTVTFKQRFADPVVVAKPLSLNDGAPATVRIRNVTSTGFEIRVQEYVYQDGTHGGETVSYLVVERGRHTLPDGTEIEAGTVTAPGDGSWVSASFASGFPSTPVVVSSVTTVNESDAVVTRNRGVDTSGFELRIQEEEKRRYNHASETVAWVAWEPGSGTVGGIRYEVGTTGDSVTHNFKTISFSSSFSSAPYFLADMQTQDGGDTANVRYRNLNASSVQVQIDEEQSKNSETNHTTEEVGYLAFEP